MSFVPRFQDLVTLFQSSVAQYGPRPLYGIRREGAWQYLSYAEVGSLVDHLRGGFASLGVGPGDRVAVIANNRLEWAIGAYATYGLRATYVPMYENQLDKEWKYILDDCGPKVCLVSSERVAARVRGLGVGSIEHVIRFDGRPEETDAYEHLLEVGTLHPAPALTPRPDEICTLIYTSGTTGNPKGVELSHANIASHISAVAEVVPTHQDDRSLAFLPWAHVFGGATELNSALALGASLAICEATDKLVDYLAEVQPTVLFAVPTIWNRIYNVVQKQIAGRPKIIQELFRTGMRAQSKLKQGEPLALTERLALALARRLIFSKITARFGGRLQYAVSGAAALSREVAEFIDNLGITVYEGYGMTESTSAAASNRPGARRIGSVGKPMPGVTITLDKQAPGAEGDIGEIIIHGPGVMVSYHNRPEETAKVLTPDGGLRTGDLGRFDADGYLYITGRVKELYKLENGKYVAPAPLEEKIALSPYIAQVMIHGSGKPYNVALIVPDKAALTAWAEAEGIAVSSFGALVQHERARKLIAGELERLGGDFKGFERVKRFTLLEEPFSLENDMLTPTLKLKRRNVLTRYEGQLESLYQGSDKVTAAS